MAAQTLSAEERSKLEAELKEITTKKEGQGLDDVRRVAEIKQALSSNGEEPAKAKSSPRASAKYPDEIKEAVRAVNEDIAKDAKTGNPGPKQHVLVRKVVTKKLGGAKKVTPDAILKASGVKSQKLLREIASREAPRSELPPLRELGSAMGDDSWAKNRHLAAILTAWIEQLKAAK